MARENKRKRDERRFGKSWRLVDYIPLPIRDWKCIEATNVHEYYLGFMEWKKEIDLCRDIPCAIPPFPDLFIEMFQKNLGIRVGMVVREIDARDEILRSALDAEAIDVAGLTAWDRSAGGYLFFDTAEFTEKAAAEFVYCMDSSGRLLGNPGIRLHEDFQVKAAILDGGNGLHLGMEMLTPFLLTISFMHFKSAATIVPVEPDVVVNRERKKAGLKPFIRYHTINIEPAKQVLRTEGQIETQGLKRALHQCRGHFATYTDNFMGRPLDKPMTVWRPAHVRGSFDEGIVVSDYNVKAPANH